ncbi:EutN/CcmL family microcompartment protein [Prauserella halophila]|uniref:EutN/CcmL family microcompartment protein n=1 Tax=Prauserella halophila TaxID=185641 RepID=A0ABN1W854_9PSEU|nr:EutN/CcmL family microcompartment protein [Prauserella halophila]MCP2235794.1 ethanolamine utilization protein EutN [Prauserella halophila]
MWLGKVIGQVISTAKDESLSGMKLLVVDEVEHTRPDGGTGRSHVAVDLVGAGQGELVLVAAGSAARVADVVSRSPVDQAVIAIADTVVVDGDVTYQK